MCQGMPAGAELSEQDEEEEQELIAPEVADLRDDRIARLLHGLQVLIGHGESVYLKEPHKI